MDLDKRKRLHIKLSWVILECKFLYYEGAKYSLKPYLSDEDYDYIESKYIKFSKKLKRKPTASSMVGFDESRPSCKIVKDYMIKQKGKSKIKLKFKRS